MYDGLGQHELEKPYKHTLACNQMSPGIVTLTKNDLRSAIPLIAGRPKI